ncbi:TPA: protein kinase/lanthionine synthetase C family protein [Enterococcus faecalis]|nr:protein kinase/lanthionine synthetase C family protein [Enterococcus faecalis]
MDLRYFEYLLDDEKYYTKFTVNDVAFTLPEIFKNNSDKFDIYYSEDLHWKEIRMKYPHLLTQGWKIHISAILSESQNILNIVSKICFNYNVSFKFVRTHGELKFKNVKYADRSSSGKFITIYPNSEEQFIILLDILHNSLLGFKNGPYILTDKRWRDGNVYFRYGGFKTIKKVNDQNNYYIYTPEGNLIVDDRDPYYKLPDFIKEPSFIQKIENEYIIDDEELSNLNKYEIIDVIHFSNGGGVYLAKSINNHSKCIIKEGRLSAGLDGENIDAFTRISREFKYLSKLFDVKGVVEPIEFFKEWENNYLVEKYIDGYVLDDWIRLNFPFIADSTTRNSYANRIINILNKLLDIINEIHSKNVAIGDLQPNNIIINDEDEVTIIDLEVASDANADNSLNIRTPGFMDKRAKTSEENDIIALINIAWYCFLPIGPISSINKTIIANHFNHIKKTFSPSISNKLYEYIYKCSNLLSFGDDYIKLLTENNNILEISINKIMEIKNSLLYTLEQDANYNSIKLFHGDIRQYETELGMYNFLYGSFGNIYTLYKYNKLNDSSLDWIDKFCDFKKYNDLGLFTGKAGIASILYNIDLKESANKLFKEVTDELDLNSPDITLLSGLSGIGLSLIEYYRATNDLNILYLVEEIGRKMIQKLTDKYFEIEPIDDFSPIGLLTGWTSISYFLINLYKLTNRDTYINYAHVAIKKDLAKCKFDGALYTEYNSILSPYLLGGSTGIAICIKEFQKLGIHDYDNQFEQILININTTNFYGVGLFRGVGSMILLSTYATDNKTALINKSLSLLELFLSYNDNEILVPGEFSYKFSNDVFSGTSGILLLLYDILNNTTDTWIPTIKQ